MILFPDKTLYQTKPIGFSLQIGSSSECKDGICLITAIGAGDTVALSMIAEKGRLWTNGQGHDQQDNLSITLSSSNKGFLIQDRGYSGFDARKKGDNFHRHLHHNVLTIASNCDKSAPDETCLEANAQSDNYVVSVQEIRKRMEEFSGYAPGASLSLLSFLLVHFYCLGNVFNV